MHDLHPIEEECINTQSISFAYDDDSTDVSDSDSEDEDQEEQDIYIENEYQADLDPYTDPSPNPRPKWAQKLIEVVGNNVGDPFDRRIIISQFQDENLVLCHSDPLLPERCYMMLGSDQRYYR